MSATTSSPSADIPCWPHKSSREFASSLESSCRCENLFEEPTIANLAAIIDHNAQQPIALPPIVPADPQDASLLSFGQERLWFLDHLTPNSPLYNIPAAVRISGPLNADALRASLNEVVRRHESLRTCFETIDGRPLQVIAESPAFELPLIELSAFRKVAATCGSQLIDEQARRPFSLREAPLLRASLLRLAETEHVFVIVVHHVISDGWSMGVFLQELATLYEAFSQEQPCPLPEPSLQYSDYAAWQRRRLQAVFDADLDYWMQQLKDVPAALDLRRIGRVRPFKPIPEHYPRFISMPS